MTQPSILSRIPKNQAEPKAREIALYTAVRQMLTSQAGDGLIRVICVGTPRNAGDSVGPMAGTFLTRAMAHLRPDRLRLEVLGTLDDPLHATNLAQRLASLPDRDCFTLAVDASTGSPGELLLQQGPLMPGAGVGRSLPPVGDAHLLCGISPLPMGFFCVHMGLVLELAELVSRAILHAALSTQRVAS